jgi:hypothetical protein
VVHDADESKKPYRVPSFEVIDITAAKAQLKTQAASTERGTQDMLSAIEAQLDERNPAR